MKTMKIFMKAITLMLMAVTMFLGTNTITANAQMMIPGCMKIAEDGRIEISCDHGSDITDASGRLWCHTTSGNPFCYYEEGKEVQRPWGVSIRYTQYLDSYLSDYVKTHDESEWPNFVIKGSDGVPFFYSGHNVDWSNLITIKGDGKVYDKITVMYYVKYCYDEKSDRWMEDKAYKGPYVAGSYPYYCIQLGIIDKEVTLEDLTEQTKEDIANGEEVNGTAVKPTPSKYDDERAEYDPDNGTAAYPDGSVLYPDGRREYPDGRIEYSDGSIEYPDGRIEYPDGHIEYPEGHIEYSINTLGATVTLSTDCIKVKTNKKGVVAQKPLPKSVKVGGKALKRNKTFVVSYEKYDDGGNEWNTVDAVREEGVYRLVITGQNGYEGVYKKRLYVTADKTIKAMSSVAVKVNKIGYSGSPITSGVIKSAKVGKRTLEEGTDYTVTYKNNVDSGTAQVTLKAVEGSGLLGTKTVNFTITGLKMNKVKVTGLKSLVYDPNAEMVQNIYDVQLTHSNGNHLYEGDDFTVAYANNTKAGTAKIVFTGKGFYNGTLTKTFKITKMPLNDGMLDEASKNIELTYTKKALKPEVKLTVGGTELKKGTDYTLAYSNNVKVSTETKPAWITVKGKGNYSGSFKVSFTIIPEVDDNAAKPNTMGILSAKEVPEEDDTVSGNSVEDEISETDDTVSGNDIPDETPAEDETPVEEENPVTDDMPASDETSDDVPVVDETPTVDETPEMDETTDETPAEDDTVSGNSLTEDADEDEVVTEDETVSEEPAVKDDTVDEKVIALSVGTLIDCEDYDQYFESYDEKEGENTKFGEIDDAKTEALRYVEEGKDGSYAVIMCEGKIICGFIKIDGNIIKY